MEKQSQQQNARATLLDDFTLSIAWAEPDARPTLEHLIVDDELILVGRTLTDGQLSVSFRVKAGVARRQILWTLLFPGESLSRLKASLQINDGPPVLLATLDGPKRTAWHVEVDLATPNFPVAA